MVARSGDPAGTFLRLPKFRHISSPPHGVLTHNVSILRGRILHGVWGQATALPPSQQLKSVLPCGGFREW